MINPKIPPLQQRSWRRELKRSCHHARDLLDRTGLGADPAIASQIASDPDFAVLASRSYINRIQPGQPNDPLLRQILPLNQEEIRQEGFTIDPLEESKFQPIPGFIRKYHGRVLLIVTGACAIHCRYCFRRNFPYHLGSAQLSHHWPTMLKEIKRDPSIREVILSGGDPLMLETEKLAKISQEISDISHVNTLRIHTRLPVVLPERITTNLLSWLKDCPLQVVMVIHSNHPNELDDEVRYVLNALHQTGITLLNQTVLLKGINDHPTVLADLSQALFSMGVLPYYLHDLDPVRGTHHFAVNEARKLELMEYLKEQLPGYLVPVFVREIPHKPYKSRIF
ncbi:MAG: EF-P beta-lysylation protein EpmB [Gammaproteobacteria bacterium]|nr:MAG: EF-P beta-lysylation protein EpmB [Gammaproteobacteria bacterium]